MKVKLNVNYATSMVGEGTEEYVKAIERFIKKEKKPIYIYDEVSVLTDDDVKPEDYMVLGEVKYMDKSNVVVRLRGSHPYSKAVYNTTKLGKASNLVYQAVYVPKARTLKSGKVKYDIIGVALFIKFAESLEFNSK